MKKKIWVYTCITGNYDNLKEIEKETGIDYYCFTNNKKIISKSWNVIYLENESNLSNIELARKIKILGHPLINNNYDILLWMDGAVTFKKKITDFINYYLKDNDTFVAFKHGQRNNIFDEAKECVITKKENKEKVQKLLKFYQDQNYPDNNGLIESTVFIKRPNDIVVKKTMDMWFNMILDFSTRDQLSFNYCIYKTGLKVKWINKKVFCNDWFDWKGHNYHSEIEKYRLYFGDQSKYNFENDIQGNYTVKNKKYFICEKIPNNVDCVSLEFSNIPCTILKSVKIKSHSNNKIEYINFINYHDKKVFYNHLAMIKIYDNFKKNSKINIELELELMSQSELFTFVNEISECAIIQESDLNFYKKGYETLNAQMNKILNSRSWKILEKLRKLYHSIKK